VFLCDGLTYIWEGGGNYLLSVKLSVKVSVNMNSICLNVAFSSKFGLRGSNRSVLFLVSSLLSVLLVTFFFISLYIDSEY
jgi:antibiotic biosynthesis monooxygenase (ABM) superfamily enzyme